MTLFPFGKFIVSQDELKPKMYWLTFVTSTKRAVVLYEKNEKRLQDIADHLNAVVTGEVEPPKPSRRR
jgi:hypothetical protein